MDYLEESILQLNKKAMQELKQKNMKHTLYYLNKALMKIPQLRREAYQPKLCVITYNNLGCYFQKIGNTEAALEYLYKASGFEQYMPKEVDNIAGTHLNICAILSEQQNHRRALQHAQKSLQIQQEAICSQPHLINTLLTSYQNVGYEYECLNRITEAAETYKRGISTAVKNNKQRSPIYNTLKSSYNFVRTPVRNKKIRLVRRPAKSVHLLKRVVKTPSKKKMSLLKNRDFSQDFTKHFARKRKIIDARLHRTQERTAAIIIQSWWKALRAKRNDRIMMKKALDIQELAKFQNAKKDKAVKKIQIWIQMVLSREIAREKYWKVVVIQRNAKTWQCRCLYRKIRNAAICIQQHYRNYKYKSTFL